MGFLYFIGRVPLPSMKLNLAYPRNGTVKQFDCSEDHIRRGNLYDFHLGQDVDGTLFAPEFEGYVFRLKGGQDKDGFPMLQGVLANARVSLLLKRGAVNFCAYRGKNGERRRKSVRGCIVASDNRGPERRDRQGWREADRGCHRREQRRAASARSA